MYHTQFQWRSWVKKLRSHQNKLKKKQTKNKQIKKKTKTKTIIIKKK
jgi:hypothetical protein